MPANQLVDEDCRIIIRNSDLEDVGEITRFNQWQHTLKLNEIGSWQLDLAAKDFESYGIDETTSLMFYREDDLLIDGPVMPNGIQYSFSEGEEKTTVIGGCDNSYIGSRICYPVTTGPLFDSITGNWRFGVQRSAVGISSSIIKGCTTQEEFYVPLVLKDAEGFLDGTTVTYVSVDGWAYTNWHQLDADYEKPLGIVQLSLGHYKDTDYIEDIANTDKAGLTSYNSLTYKTNVGSSKGIRTYYAMYDGTEQYAPATSNPVFINVGKTSMIPVSLTFTADDVAPPLNHIVNFVITIGMALQNKPIEIYHYQPDGTLVHDTDGSPAPIPTDVNGQAFFTDQAAYDTVGVYTYYAQFEGDGTYAATTSPFLTINVGGEPAPNNTSITLLVDNAYPNENQDITFTVNFFGAEDSTLRIVGVDLSTNTITLKVPQQYPALLAPTFPDSGRLYQTSGGIVDDPTYLGYDTQTGVADIIAKRLVYFNAGKGACSDHFGTRSVPHLVIAPPKTQGSIVTANSRGENLLTQVQNVCLSGGINFRTAQIGKDIVFDTFVGNDLSQNSNLVFSVEMGNLKEYSYTYGPPISNMIWGCGPQTGVDKIMLPSANKSSIDQYGRWESWLNSATANAGDSIAQINANMVQSNNAALAESVKNAQLTLTIQETDQVRYPRDFGLGDKIRVMVGKKAVDEIITSLMYILPSGTGSGSGSTLAATLTKQETRQMRAQIATTKLLQQITMA